MFTRRDLVMAAGGASIAAALVTAAGAQPSKITSTAFEWNDLKVTETKAGSRRSIVRAATPLLEELEMHVTTLNPGMEPHPPHKHVAEELFIVREGTVEALVNGELKRVGPGSVIFQASNVMHGIKNVGTTPATYHVIQWLPVRKPE